MSKRELNNGRKGGLSRQKQERMCEDLAAGRSPVDGRD